MNMDFTQLPWSIMMPEIILLGTILILLLAELTRYRGEREKGDVLLPILSLLGLMIAMFSLWTLTGKVDQILNDSFRLDGFALLFKWIILGGTFLVVLLSMQDGNGEDAKSRGEYYILLLTAALGGMFMASSGDLITLFVGLELLSVSSYIMVGLRKRNIQSNEASFKYVVNGGIATATFLFGASYLYGLSGTTNLFQMAQQFAQPGFMNSFGTLVYAAFFFVVVGLSFKISTVPFHMWAPDVYQGAPTTVTAFLSVVSKAAGFAMLIRIFFTSFAWVSYQGGGTTRVILHDAAIYLAILSALSMILGNIMALRQINVKRMMAYSAIAHAGYILVPFAAYNNLMIDQVIFYLFAYLFTNLGVFALIDGVTRERGTEEIRAFAGLYHRSPFTALAMTILLLSLAGFPITAGFSGKLYILLGAIQNGNLWLASILIVTSVIAYYYYFGIIRQMYMRPGQTEAPLRLPTAVLAVMTIGLIGTLIGGFFPGQVLQWIQDPFSSNSLFQIFDGKF
ncbi:NADH-quinone oxidoreductase subunit NuoN [Thermicanus aegyptius]|uniref:NADH-quinone oxidoreductase subunit NuoN n=1 Tax=Thermicanus aegyptius TaxID=94009 RepID=UPI000411DA6C|nr:NADH-quinone oxidoreductase subunit NuoN [Thermicanus aegyptius]